MHENEIHVLLAVVQYKTKLQVPRQGLCSTYLANLPENALVHGWVQPGSFRFPAPVKKNLIAGYTVSLFLFL